MTKRIIAGLLTVGVLGGLAYYSGSLYSEKALAEDGMRFKAPIVPPFREEYWTYGEDNGLNERQKRQLEEVRQEVSVDADKVQAETENALYYVVVEAGYVNIYQDETLYEVTGIAMDELPKEVQEEIYRGKRLAGEGELYDFLENYTS